MQPTLTWSMEQRRSTEIRGLLNASRTINNSFEVDEEAAVKPIALAYYHRDTQPDELNPAHVLHDDAGGCVEKFVDIVRLVIIKIKGRVGTLLCPTSFHSASNVHGRMLRWNICKALSWSLCRNFASREEVGHRKWQGGSVSRDLGRSTR